VAKSDQEYLFDIDENDLTGEWLRHVRLYERAATDLASRRADHEQLKSEKELVVADLDHEVRRDPIKFGLEKATEKSIDNAVVRSRLYQDVQTRLLKAKHDVDIFQAKVDTLEHRKKALENMVSLFLAGYFTAPSLKKNEQAAMDDAVKREVRKRGQVAGG